MTGDWTRQDEITSVRAKRAIAFGDKMAELANGGSDRDWDLLLPMIDSTRFKRRGNERDQEMDWPTYRAMLDQWGGHSGLYEKRFFRATEAGNVVYLDLDERAVSKDGKENALRSISIYEFDETDRIIGVDVCMGFHQPQ
ncbi:MAG: hypothetical protein ABIT04_08550 [Novosphingobium sp.]